MAHLTKALRPSTLRGLAGLTTTLMLGACAQTADLLPTALIDTSSSETPAVAQAASSMSELQKATAYWGQEYAKRPLEVAPAIAYARNLKALGEKQKAMQVLQRSYALHTDNRELAGEYGLIALELGQISTASKLLAMAEDPANPNWRMISARGTILAKQGQYGQAIPYYERALALAPSQSSVLNNLAMAQAMNGEPKKAEDLLRKAMTEPSSDPDKIRQNLALVLGLQGRYAEAKSVTAGTQEQGATAQNVDVVRTIVQLPPKPAPGSALAQAKPDFNTQMNSAIATATPARPDLKPTTNAADPTWSASTSVASARR